MVLPLAVDYGPIAAAICARGLVDQAWLHGADALAGADTPPLLLAGCLESARAPSASVSGVPTGARRAGTDAPTRYGGIRGNLVPSVPLCSCGGRRQQLYGRWIRQRTAPRRRRRNWIRRWKRERQLQYGRCWLQLQPRRGWVWLWGRIWCWGGDQRRRDRVLPCGRRVQHRGEEEQQLRDGQPEGLGKRAVPPLPSTHRRKEANLAMTTTPLHCQGDNRRCHLKPFQKLHVKAKHRHVHQLLTEVLGSTWGWLASPALPSRPSKPPVPRALGTPSEAGSARRTWLGSGREVRVRGVPPATGRGDRSVCCSRDGCGDSWSPASARILCWIQMWCNFNRCCSSARA